MYDANGVENFEQEDIRRVVFNYYTELFTSSRPNISMDLLEGIETRLSDSMRLSLSQRFTREEVVVAFRGMHPAKSAGPDGFPALFYNKLSLVGDEVCDLVCRFLNHGGMPEGVNDTTVVLIPKTRRPKDMKDLRPISLCNISYKLISKILANRLKVFLPDIIDDN